MAAYIPAFQAQLDGSATASSDCGPRSASMGIDWQTRGARVPGMAEFRRRAGTVGDRPNTTATLLKGITSYDTPRETNGYAPLKAERHVQEPVATLRAAVKADRFVVLSMDYGTLNNRRPDLSGDPRFYGGHTVGVLGERLTGDGSHEWRVFDPLADGRRAGIPQGPDWWPRRLVERCAEDFAKREGTFTGLLLRRPREIPEPEPPPEPPKPTPPTQAEVIEQLRATIDDLEQRNAGLRAALRNAEARITAAVGVLQGSTFTQVQADLADPVVTGTIEQQ